MIDVIFAGLLEEPLSIVTYEADIIITLEETSFKLAKHRFRSIEHTKYNYSYSLLTSVLEETYYSYIDSSNIKTFNDFIKKYPEFKL
jgi:hypothetical protein